MPKKTLWTSIANGIALLLTGLSLGYIIGQSVSPVLSIIIGSLITVIVTLLSILMGINTPSGTVQEPGTNFKSNTLKVLSAINVVPLAILMTTLAIGSSFGIYVRTNEVLGTNPNALIERWTKDPKLKDKLKEELFRKTYLENTQEARSNQLTAGLFAVEAQDCDLLNLKKGDELKASLLLVSNGTIDSLINGCQSEECLEKIKNMICNNK